MIYEYKKGEKKKYFVLENKMSNRCNDNVFCPYGDCVGCKNYQTWCYDPRCSPYCPNCSIPEDHDYISGVVIIILIFCLIVIFFLIWISAEHSS